jgi:nucleotide-binding universal stress UspA family protein
MLDQPQAVRTGDRGTVRAMVVGTSLRDDGLDTAGYVTRGDPLEPIRCFCEERHIDTIALGTHDKAGTEAFWHGSLAQRLIRTSSCSLLLTPVSE